MTEPIPGLPPTTFLNLIWEGQEGIFETRRTLSKSVYGTKIQALAKAPQSKYFGVLARSRHGSRDRDVQETGNVCWVDFDDVPAFDEWRDTVLGGLGLEPAAITASGGGYWCFFKLSKSIAADEIVDLNRRLALTASVPGRNGKNAGDLASCNRGRIARIPGSVNEKYGTLVRVQEMSGVLTDPDVLRRLPEPPTPAKANASSGSGAVTLDGSPVLGTPPLPDWLTSRQALYRAYCYRGDLPADRSRSELECSISCSLFSHGYSMEQVRAIADCYFHKHREEKARGNTGYLDATLQNAYSRVQANPSPRSNSGGACVSSELCGGSGTSRKLTWKNAAPLLGCVRGQTVGGLVEEIAKTFRISESSAEKWVNGLTVHGLIEKRPDPASGRRKVCVLTSDGQKVLERPRSILGAATLNQGRSTRKPKPEDG